MWQRFTERSRETILRAQVVAASARSETVGTEHLLLAILEDTTSVALSVLVKLGPDLDAMRVKLREHVFGNEAGPRGEPRLTSDAKRVLGIAADDARKLKCNYIGNEHLLLALSRKDQGVAGRTLRDAGVDYAALFRATSEYLGPERSAEKKSFLDLLAEGRSPSEVAEGVSPMFAISESIKLSLDAKIVLIVAKLEADLAGLQEVDGAHLLLGLLRHEEGRASQWLKERGVSIEQYREFLARTGSGPQA